MLWECLRSLSPPVPEVTSEFRFYKNTQSSLVTENYEEIPNKDMIKT